MGDNSDVTPKRPPGDGVNRPEPPIDFRCLTEADVPLLHRC
jgi:hypothetical protein